MGMSQDAHAHRSSPDAECEVMALLEQIICATEQAQLLIQDDSLITGEGDMRGLRDAMMRIRALTLQVDALLREVARERGDGPHTQRSPRPPAFGNQG